MAHGSERRRRRRPYTFIFFRGTQLFFDWSQLSCSLWTMSWYAHVTRKQPDVFDGDLLVLTFCPELEKKKNSLINSFLTSIISLHQHLPSCALIIQHYQLSLYGVKRAFSCYLDNGGIVSASPSCSVSILGHPCL